MLARTHTKSDGLECSGVRVLVIGSNSFSGAHFVAYLLQRGAEVIGISRSVEHQDVYLPYRWNGVPANFRFLLANVNDDLRRIVAVLQDMRPEYVVNFGAQSMVAESWTHPTHWFRTNVLAQVALHDELRKMRFMRRYLHVATPEVYGTCDGPVTEDHPFRPSTPYAVSRAACDLSLRTFLAHYGFPVVTTRAGNVYGPAQRLYRIIPRTIMMIRLGQKLPLHGGGASLRSFVHIRDVAEGTYLAMKKGQPGECFHLATMEPVTIRALVDRVCVRAGVNVDDVVEIVGERPGKDQAYLLDSTRARTRLGWSDTVSLDEGIDDTMAWIDRHFDVLKDEPLDYVHKV